MALTRSVPSYQAQDAAFMELALEQARLAAALGEVPVGAVVVRDGQVIAAAHNLRETGHRATAHAEVLAIEQACAVVGSWRLEGCTLYVTLEPCPMCAGAILNARIARVWYGARDSAMGACGGVVNLYMEDFANRPALVGGILAQECRQVLSDFFSSLRTGEKSGI